MASSLASYPKPRVLLAEESLPVRRLIREALQSFRCCEVDETPSAERAFELGLARTYHLLIFSLGLPDFDGLLLDRLLNRAYPLAHPGNHTAPPVIFLIREGDAASHPRLGQEARVRGLLPCPPRLDTLLAMTSGLLPDSPAASRPPLPPPPFPAPATDHVS